MSDISEYLDKRLDRLEDKLDEVHDRVRWMVNKYWMLVGMASVVSTIASVILIILFGAR